MLYPLDKGIPTHTSPPPLISMLLCQSGVIIAAYRFSVSGQRIFLIPVLFFLLFFQELFDEPFSSFHFSF
jgi:hypothetical protein